MPVFAYRGFDGQGRAVHGTQDADSARAIKATLRRDGIFLTDLTESSSATPSGPARSLLAGLKARPARVSAQDLAGATRQLATLIGAGITLVDALNAPIDQVDNPHFKQVWAEVKQKVNEGAGFGDALSTHTRVFSGLYVNMVRAGESSGALDIVLNRLADFTESQADLRSKLIGTMVYPALMVVMANVVIAVLMIFVIPKISRLFLAQKAVLPLPTRVLIGLSNVAKDWWFAFVPVALLLGWAAKRYVGTPSGRARWDRALLTMPLFGPLVRMVAITRFTKTLSTLIGSGVPLLSAFDIVKNVVENTELLKVIETARDCVKEGESIAAPLKRSGHFPPMVTHMIAIGEKSGSLEEMLANISRSYDVQIDSRLRALTSVLEPLLIVVMGVVVAFIVFAVLLPMMQMSSFA